MSDAPLLLSEPTNNAVVQLPGRRFPGVVFQGDSLHNLVAQLDEMQRMVSGADLEGLRDEIEDMRESLGEVLAFYELVCQKNGISLPY